MGTPGFAGRLGGALVAMGGCSLQPLPAGDGRDAGAWKDDAVEVALPPGMQRSCPTPQVPGCGMVRLLGATLTMGMVDTSGDWSYDALPPRTVRVDGFWIDRYEVTVARFERFWATAGASYRSPSPIAYPGEHWIVLEPDRPFAPPDRHDGWEHHYCNWGAPWERVEAHPINCVDWYTAMAFCAWDGGERGRLPTQAEWERAARGIEERPWPWGGPMFQHADVLDRHVCWNRGLGRLGTPGTCPVGTFVDGATRDGIHDLAGNVWEWTADDFESGWSSTMTAATQHNPLCRGANTGRVLRGGSWLVDNARRLRPVSRRGEGPGIGTVAIGFRCARTP